MTFAKAACRYAMEQGCAPVAVHLLYPQILDNVIPVECEAGIGMGLRVLEACDEMWMGGNQIFQGMRSGQAAAEQFEIPAI